MNKSFLLNLLMYTIPLFFDKLYAELINLYNPPIWGTQDII